jgi:hypothetical protein
VLSRLSWPNLTEEERVGTSPRSTQYNCIAWAAGTDQVWWEPNDPRYTQHAGPTTWPEGVPHVVSIEACIQAFASLGYVLCDTPGLEPGFEKVALYADELGDPTHAARQLSSGLWTSKMGDLEDTEHASVHSVEGPIYGRAVAFLKRPRLHADD